MGFPWDLPFFNTRPRPIWIDGSLPFDVLGLYGNFLILDGFKWLQRLGNLGAQLRVGLTN